MSRRGSVSRREGCVLERGVCLGERRCVLGRGVSRRNSCV